MPGKREAVAGRRRTKGAIWGKAGRLTIHPHLSRDAGEVLRPQVLLG